MVMSTWQWDRETPGGATGYDDSLVVYAPFEPIPLEGALGKSDSNMSPTASTNAHGGFRFGRP